MFALAKLIAWLFKKFYALMYHLILGVVIGSTIAIIPKGVVGWEIALSALCLPWERWLRMVCPNWMKNSNARICSRK